nr:restriction endonuclease subunit S [uncultured Marinobacter sp.]
MLEHNLPSGWTSSTLGLVCSKLTDGSHNPPKGTAVGQPMLSAKNIQNGMIDFQQSHRLIPAELFEVEDRRTKVSTHDVLLTIVGALGRTAVVPKNFGKFTLQRSVAVLAAPDLNTSTFRYSLESYDFQQQILDNAKGTAQKGIYLKKLRELTIPIPPLAEQKVIADKLDTLLTQVENTKARLERVPPILKRFRQSVLAAAVSGRLTEEWRNQNGLSITDWDAFTVGGVATVATGKTPSRKEPKYWKDGDVPWLTSASTGAIFTDSAEQFVTKIAVGECSLKIFPPGTLLLAMYGEGKTRGQVTELRLSATCNQACAAVTANEQKTLRSYLKLRLLENYEETRKAAAGGAQPNLNLNKVRAIGISVPDKEEQTEIVRRVDQLFVHADRIEQQVNNALARVNNLTQSILAKAFRGELTEQWRKDNPELIRGENSAAALLERITAERAAVKPAKKARKNPSA